MQITERDLERRDLEETLSGGLQGEMESVKSTLESLASRLEELGLKDNADALRALFGAADGLTDDIADICGAAQDAYESRFGLIGGESVDLDSYGNYVKAVS